MLVDHPFKVCLSRSVVQGSPKPVGSIVSHPWAIMGAQGSTCHLFCCADMQTETGLCVCVCVCVCVCSSVCGGSLDQHTTHVTKPFTGLWSFASTVLSVQLQTFWRRSYHKYQTVKDKVNRTNFIRFKGSREAKCIKFIQDPQRAFSQCFVDPALQKSSPRFGGDQVPSVEGPGLQCGGTRSPVWRGPGPQCGGDQVPSLEGDQVSSVEGPGPQCGGDQFPSLEGTRSQFGGDQVSQCGGDWFPSQE